MGLLPALIIPRPRPGRVTKSAAGVRWTNWIRSPSLNPPRSICGRTKLSVGLETSLNERETLRGRYCLFSWGGWPWPTPARAQERMLTNLKALVEKTDLFTCVSLINAKGRVVASTDPTWRGRDLSETLYYQQGLQKSFISPPFQESPQKPAANRRGCPTDPSSRAGGRSAFLVGYSDISVLNRIMDEPMGFGPNRRKLHNRFRLYSVDSATIQHRITGYAGEKPKVYASPWKTRSAAMGTTPTIAALRPSEFYSWLPALQVVLAVEQDIAEVYGSFTMTLIINLCLGFGFDAAYHPRSFHRHAQYRDAPLSVLSLGRDPNRRR